jgi:predicted Ser/Thr protein kinase
MSATLEKKLREKIKLELEKVTAINMPSVYALIQTQSGYKKVENDIITMMVKNGYSAGGCIPNLERIL